MIPIARLTVWEAHQLNRIRGSPRRRHPGSNAVTFRQINLPLVSKSGVGSQPRLGPHGAEHQRRHPQHEISCGKSAASRLVAHSRVGRYAPECRLLGGPRTGSTQSEFFAFRPRAVISGPCPVHVNGARTSVKGRIFSGVVVTLDDPLRP
jgi:hypothetical protein